jgi:hypothetical protein
LHVINTQQERKIREEFTGRTAIKKKGTRRRRRSDQKEKVH